MLHNSAVRRSTTFAEILDLLDGTHVADAEAAVAAHRSVIRAAAPAMLRTQIVGGRLTT